MFENLTDRQRALLHRAVNTELNVICREYAKSVILKEDFREQHRALFPVFQNIYDEPMTEEEDFNNRISFYI